MNSTRETVIAEAGAMNYMEEHITFEAKWGMDQSKTRDCSVNYLMWANGHSRVNRYMTHFTNRAWAKSELVLPLLTGKIICVDLQEHNQNILCQKDSFLCAALGTNVSIAFPEKIGHWFLEGRFYSSKNFRRR